jgi:hypothetical protein
MSCNPISHNGSAKLYSIHTSSTVTDVEGFKWRFHLNFFTLHDANAYVALQNA